MAATYRFAPSPTGLLHLGNARTLMLNACLAMLSGGRLILRLDDTDLTRTEEAFVEAIREDVAWLGVTPDATVRQSERIALYDAAAGRLRGSGRLYPAYETPEELAAARDARLARGEPVAYDRAALELTNADRARLERDGRRPHWRFRLDTDRPVAWEDGVRGACEVDPASLSDPVLIREDGAVSYTLASVVDDIELAVTEVVRGEDHVTNTGVQLQLFAALGAPPPRFAHHNLFTTPEGEGLSKRLGHLSLRSLREAGIEPTAVASLAALHGTSTAPRAVANLAELAPLVSLAAISRAPAAIDPGELTALSARTVHALPYAAARDRLGDIPEAFWLAVRGNCARVGDAAGWWHRLRGPTDPAAEPDDAAYLGRAAAALPPGPLDGETWETWTAALKAATGRRGRALFMPLRRALTGLDHGPEMAALLAFIPREAALARLQGRRG